MKHSVHPKACVVLSFDNTVTVRERQTQTDGSVQWCHEILEILVDATRRTSVTMTRCHQALLDRRHRGWIGCLAVHTIRPM